MVRRHFFLVGALVVLVLMVVAGGLRMATGGGGSGGPGGPGGPGGRGGPGGGVDIAATTVVNRTFTDQIEVLGVAKGRQSVTLTAAATQLVEAVRFSDGQSVPAGAVLVELKAAEQDAGVAQARARLAEAEQALNRWKTLAESGYASQAAVDQRQAAFLTAKADLAAAQARQGDRLIRAPFAGVVGLTDIAPGALVNPGATIVTLDDLSAIRVDFQIPERYLADLAQGQAIEATTDAFPGYVARGRIDTLDTRIDPDTRAITARAVFPNPDRQLRPGMMMRVSLARGQRQVLAVPEPALSVQGSSSFVFLISEAEGQTRAEQRPVEIGARQNGFVEVREGVNAGDRIVANGLNKVTSGQTVRIAETADPADVARVQPQAERPGA